MPPLTFDHYYRYDELTRILHAFAEEFPNLMRVESIGKSHEGREVWLATLTNLETGTDRERPALWVDGNIHATEVSPASACVYFINHLVTNYGKDAGVTRALDTRAFYICPRVNPDGAEWALADHPKIIRSSTRPYPYDEEPIEGLLAEDVDGDGRMLNMRIRDPNGPWIESDQDPRVLVQRDPAEVGGTYFRILPEGRIENYDGALITVAARKERLDLNRNFPSGWRQEGEQPGSGPFPASEPEVRNLTQFITSHPNITGGVAFHTFGGVILRPFDMKPDDEFPAEDLWTYKKIGEKGTQLTGYPNASVYHDFRYHPKEFISGAFDTWMYEHLGVFAWTVEIWSPQRQAGIEKYKFIDWYREHPVEEDLQLLKWNDEVLDGKGYVNWYEFDHPQLGKVELGGWNYESFWRNPPPVLLEKEIALFPNWLLWHALISPRLEILEATAKALGDDTYRVRLVVQNSGWLPTYVAKKALEHKAVRGAVCEIELPEGAKLETGKVREEIGQLEGRAYKESAVTVWVEDPTQDRARVEWTVKAPRGAIVKLLARHERAGVARANITLS